MIIRRTGRIAFGVLVGMLLIFAGFAVFAARLAVFPWWYKPQFVGEKLADCSSYQQKVYQHCHDPLVSFGFEFKEFKAVHKGAREISTQGWWVPLESAQDSKGVVILVHGGGADRRAMLKHSKYLHEAGYHALLIDCFNHGLAKGDGRGISFGLWESRSILAAVDWAKKNILAEKTQAIFVMGTSQGAFAALRAAAESKDITGVIAENSYISVRRVLLEFRALEWLPKLAKIGSLALISFWLDYSVDDLDFTKFAAALSKTKVFLIHGKKDGIVQTQHSQEIFEHLTGKKELWLIEEGQHEYLWNQNKDEYQKRILNFLAAGP